VVKENKLENNKSVDKNKSDNKSVINNKVKEKNINKDTNNNDIKNNKENKDNISVNNNNRRNYYFSLIKSKINVKEDSLSISDLKITTRSNDFHKNKIQNTLYKGNIKDSLDKKINNTSLKETERNYEKAFKNENKDQKGNENNNGSDDENHNNNENSIKKNISISKEISNNLSLNNSRNKKEEYFRSFRKKNITDLSTSMKIMKMDSTSSNNNNISLKKKSTNFGILSGFVTKRNSSNIQEKTSEKSLSINKSNKTKKIIKPKKSLSINEFSYSNIKDLGKILSKLDTKVNINLKSSVINFHKISSNQFFSKEKNKGEESLNSQNMKIIDDSNNEESQLVKNDNFGEKVKRKDSFITKFNRFKKIVQISRKSSSKIIDGNLKNQSQNVGPNKNNNLGSSNNLDHYEIKKESSKNENSSNLKKK
jgi:histone acetyltransferase